MSSGQGVGELLGEVKPQSSGEGPGGDNHFADLDSFQGVSGGKVLSRGEDDEVIKTQKSLPLSDKVGCFY